VRLFGSKANRVTQSQIRTHAPFGSKADIPASLPRRKRWCARITVRNGYRAAKSVSLRRCGPLVGNDYLTP
jgi:hypothetical protein